MDSSIKNRQYWGKKVVKLPPIDLTLVQRESYAWFLDIGIKELLSEISPIDDFTGKNWSLKFGNYIFGKHTHTAAETNRSYFSRCKFNHIFSRMKVFTDI